MPSLPNPTPVRGRAAGALLAVISALLLAGPFAAAQQAIEVSPANHRASVPPGGGLDGVILVRNPLDVPVPVNVQLADFVLQPNGAIRPLPIGSLPTSAGAWTTVSDDVLLLDADGEIEFRYRVDVPEDAADGTYWSTIVFRSDPSEEPDLDAEEDEALPDDLPDDVLEDILAAPEEGAAIRFVAQVGYVLYVDVGDPTREVRIASIRSDGERTLAVEVQNTGNGYVRLDGRVELLDLDGEPVGTVSFPAAASLPGGVTTLTAEVPAHIGEGAYLAAAVVDGGDDIVAGQAQVELR